MSSSIIIRNVEVFDGETMLGARDVTLAAGVISAVTEPQPEEHYATTAARVIDGAGRLLSPGFIDLHSHLRDPGQTWKEDLVTGTRAAAAGGFTTVVCMPNTDPPVDIGAVADYIRDKAERDGFCRVSPAGCISRNRSGTQLSELASLYAAGCRVFTDDGSDTMRADVFVNAFEFLSMFPGARALIHTEVTELAQGHMHDGEVSALLGHPGIHRLSEDLGSARAILVALATGQPVQVTHMASGGTVSLARYGKSRAYALGRPELVTCDATFNHLLLTDSVVRTQGSQAKINPPLRTEADRRALLNALGDGTLDALVTDHAPHTLDEKTQELQHAPFGFVGFELAFGLLNQHVVGSETLSGPITLERILRLMTSQPADILNGTYKPELAKPMRAMAELLGEYTSSDDPLDKVAVTQSEASRQFDVLLSELPRQVPELGAQPLEGFRARELETSPGRIREGLAADVVLLDPNAKWKIDPDKFHSKGRNTPFVGWQAKGKVLLTCVAGRITHEDGVE